MTEALGMQEKSPRWIFNTSPLINLGKLELLDLLGQLRVQVIISGGVAAEIHAGPKLDPAQQWLSTDGATFLHRSPAVPESIARWGLGQGESEVLTIAWQDQQSSMKCEAIIDDLGARKCANTLNLMFRGTLGVLLHAKKHGLVPKLRPLIEELDQLGAHLSKIAIKTALQLAQE